MTRDTAYQLIGFISAFVLIIITARSKEPESLEDFLKTHPVNLIKQTELNDSEKAFFSKWAISANARGLAFRFFKGKIRWDGGASEGYLSIKIGRDTFPVKVDYTYPGQPPKKPRTFYSMRTTTCRKVNTKHYKVTRTGKEVEIIGRITSIKKPMRKCICGKPELFVIKMDLRWIK